VKQQTFQYILQQTNSITHTPLSISMQLLWCPPLKIWFIAWSIQILSHVVDCCMWHLGEWEVPLLNWWASNPGGLRNKKQWSHMWGDDVEWCIGE
jgi:hypothetical protein